MNVFNEFRRVEDTYALVAGTICYVLTFYRRKMSDKFSQNPHNHQKRQNDVSHGNMNMDASPSTNGAS